MYLIIAGVCKTRTQAVYVVASLTVNVMRLFSALSLSLRLLIYGMS